MKKLILAAFSVVAISACNQTVGTGALDLGSLSQDISYHEQTESTVDGSFSYARIDLKANGTFTQTEAQWTTPTVGKKCDIEGTWVASTPDANSSAGNELVITVNKINSVTLGTPIEKRYDLRNLSASSLIVKYTATSDVVDLTNIDDVTYPEYNAVNPVSLTYDTFCDR